MTPGEGTPEQAGNGASSGRARRVLVVASELPPGPGGIGAHAHAVATGLASEGRVVAVLGSQHYAGDLERQAFNSASPVPVTTFVDRGDPVRTALDRGRQLRDAIAAHRPDVVVASGGRVLWLAAAVCRRAGVPFVAVTHGSEVGGSRWQQELTRRAIDRAAAVVAVSRFTATLTARLGVPRDRIEVIHNGADGDRFHRDPDRGRAFRDRHGLGDGPVILTVGNVTERKGQHQVVEALPALVGAVPDVRYVLVGQPTEGDALERLARRLGVSDRVLLLGQLPSEEIGDAYCAADLFAMTSTSTSAGKVEGFGIAVVEAALSGVPAVVCRGTGAEEAVVDGKTGIVVAPDPAAIAGGLASLLTDDARRAEVGAAAEAAARSGGTWSARVTEYGRVIDRVVAERAVADDPAGARRPRIVVISHTAHHRTPHGEVVGFGPTLRELDQLASLASELVHVAPLLDSPPPGNALPVRAGNVRHVPVRNAGGPGWRHRIGALGVVPHWAWTINREVGRADVVHVRCPAGISMVALAVLRVRRTPRARWVKYAGNWSPTGPDPLTYRLQRWWLRRGWARAEVTVNGRWPDQPPWVHPFDNPTLTASELEAGRRAAADRPAGPPFRAVFVGRLEREKGAHRALEITEELRSRGIDIELDLIGDGPLRPWVEQRLAGGAGAFVAFHGWLSRAELEGHLARAHVMLLPTIASEGFPKAVGEALAFGCVPVTSGISSMGQILGETGGAVVVEADGEGSDRVWADAVEAVLTDGRLATLSAEGVAAAARFSYATYLDRVRGLASSWDVEL